MAVVTEMESVSPMIPPGNGTESEKKRPGRPLGAKNKANRTEPEPEPEDSKEPEAQITGNKDFWLMVANFSVDDWNSHIAYLYRLAPVIDRKSNGKPANVQAFSTSFSREDIMKEHGSGAYLIYLNKIDPVSGKGFRVAIEKFTIVNPKYPPNVPPGDWVEDKGNEVWKWGVASQPGQPTAIAGAQYPPGFNINTVYDKAFEMAEKLSPKEDSSTNILLGKLIEGMFAKQNTAPAPPDTKQQDRLFEMLLEDRKVAREELNILREKLLNAPPPKSLIEQFIEIKPQLQDLLKLFGQKASQTDVWAEIAKQGIGELPGVIELIRDGMKKPEPQLNNGAAHPQARVTAPTTAAASVDPPSKPVDQMTDEEKRGYVDQLWKKWGGHLLQISTRLIEEFTIQDQGYSFRDWYVEMYGKLRWADLKRDVAPELMSNMYIAHPQLQKVLAPPERLNVFLTEFATDFGAEDDIPIKEKLAGVKPAGAVEPDEVTASANQSEAK